MKKTQKESKRNPTGGLRSIGTVVALIFLIVAPAAATTLSIDDIFTTAGEETTTHITITNAINLGVVDINLTFDPSLVQVTAVTNSDLDFLHAVVNNATGVVRIGGMDYGDGVNGDITLAELTVKAVGEHGDTGALQVSINELKEAGTVETSIPATVENSMAYINLPPIGFGISAHRYNNVHSPFQSIAVFDASRSHDPDGDAITAYAWDFGDGSASAGETVEHAYKSYRWADGSYEPFYTVLAVSDSGGLLNTTVIPIAVYIPGDANGDGEVNILDAVWIGKQWRTSCNARVSGGYLWDDPQADGADLNNDCIVDILDAVIVGANWRETAW
ncbi:MAG: hypothetical protein JW878_02755 [Methanomicrobia archaeon]|nr:hypothetical protein [Methanomicrobia archaeon]